MSSLPTMDDVAAAAGVSVSTVSRALTGRWPVREATRRRVADAVERLGYRRHRQPPARYMLERDLDLMCAVLRGSQPDSLRTAELTTLRTAAATAVRINDAESRTGLPADWQVYALIPVRRMEEPGHA